VALFRRQMDATIGEDLIAAGVRVYLDDIIVFSRTRQDHLALLDKVFERMLDEGMKIRISKCSFLQNQVEYLGYNLSGEGIEVAPERIQAWIDAPAPANGSKVRGLLGGFVMLRRFDHQRCMYCIVPESRSLLETIKSFKQTKSRRSFLELLRNFKTFGGT